MTTKEHQMKWVEMEFHVTRAGKESVALTLGDGNGFLGFQIEARPDYGVKVTSERSVYFSGGAYEDLKIKFIEPEE